MLVKKITLGYVVQVFNTDTGHFVSQNFVAGDTTEYEDEKGNPVNSEKLNVEGTEAYLPFDMVQPVD